MNSACTMLLVIVLPIHAAAYHNRVKGMFLVTSLFTQTDHQFVGGRWC